MEVNEWKCIDYPLGPPSDVNECFLNPHMCRMMSAEAPPPPQAAVFTVEWQCHLLAVEGSVVLLGQLMRALPMLTGSAVTSVSAVRVLSPSSPLGRRGTPRPEAPLSKDHDQYYCGN